MKLSKFIDKFIDKNSLIRLLYEEGAGHTPILGKSWESVDMEWKVKKEGRYYPYRNHKVLYITDILVGGNYPEAINIVIEKIPLGELRDKKIKDLGI